MPFFPLSKGAFLLIGKVVTFVEFTVSCLVICIDLLVAGEGGEIVKMANNALYCLVSPTSLLRIYLLPLRTLFCYVSFAEDLIDAYRESCKLVMACKDLTW